ncbi:PHD-finger domain-containing protein [Xylariales sp. AK1849]|nr:PHD-finger domain-containing protein [Xylariales sp. AK1849]
MTEKPYPLSMHIVPPSQTTVLSPKSTPALLHHASSKIETVEEEPYTIKCICTFSDDDGNTIYCEQCDTWQHIECYYPHNIQDAYREDFAHSCSECKPRPLDHHSAIERQRLRRTRINTQEGPTDRKTKRPPSKSHKKTKKPSDLQLNGHSGSDSNTKHSQEHSHPHGLKKSKSTHHRQSQSISSAKRSPSYGQKNGHPPSPATTPPDLPADTEIHNYSRGFMTLYKDDRDIQIVQTNSFASLVISNLMSVWLRDHEKLRNETGWEYADVFQPLPSNIDSLKRTPVVEHKKHLAGPDTVLHWQYLSTPHAIENGVPLVELNGQIGIQKDYCGDPANRWADLSSPLPFVFFHPMLPLYIDTRREGSLARYVRRSCRPNATLDTYLSGGSEYQLWLVSDRRIAPNEQITIPWDFRLPKLDSKWMLQHVGLGDEEASAQPDFDPSQMDQYQSIASWLHQILSEHGGCACDLGPDCAFARYHRKYISRSSSKSSSHKKKSRRPKTHAISPTSTGQATNSRAPSEGIGEMNGDDGAEDDSGSSHSKPPSRDTTPVRQGSFDTLGILTEPTDRDKRKVAMVEDTFRRMEQQQPPRKKKRTSDGTGSTATSKPKSRTSTGDTPGPPNGTSDRRYVDAGTNRGMSGSPHSATTPNTGNPLNQPASRHGSAPMLSRYSSEGPGPEYCDASVQTDPVEGEWFSSSPLQTSKVKRRVVSLSKRLLENRHRLRADMEERRRLSTASPTSVASAMIKMDLDSPTDPNTRPESPVMGKENVATSMVNFDQASDLVMRDAPSVSPTDTKFVTSVIPASTASNIKLKSPELKVLMPPVPTFNSTLSTSSSATTPFFATGNMVQSPFSPSGLPSPFGPPAVNGVAAHPSPIKKKLSLSDYTKRTKAVATKPVATSLKLAGAITEEANSPTATDVAMSDAPTTEKAADS